MCLPATLTGTYFSKGICMDDELWMGAEPGTNHRDASDSMIAVVAFNPDGTKISRYWEYDGEDETGIYFTYAFNVGDTDVVAVANVSAGVLKFRYDTGTEFTPECDISMPLVMVVSDLLDFYDDGEAGYWLSLFNPTQKPSFVGKLERWMVEDDECEEQLSALMYGIDQSSAWYLYADDELQLVKAVV